MSVESASELVLGGVRMSSRVAVDRGSAGGTVSPPMALTSCGSEGRNGTRDSTFMTFFLGTGSMISSVSFKVEREDCFLGACPGQAPQLLLTSSRPPTTSC